MLIPYKVRAQLERILPWKSRRKKRRVSIVSPSSHFPVVWRRRPSVFSHRATGKKACSVAKRWTASFPFYRTRGGSRAWRCSLDLRTQVKLVIVSRSHDHTAEEWLPRAHSQPAPSGYSLSLLDTVPPGPWTIGRVACFQRNSSSIALPNSHIEHVPQRTFSRRCCSSNSGIPILLVFSVVIFFLWHSEGHGVLD